MLKEFKVIPEPLQRKLILQVGLGLCGLLVFIFLLATLRNFGIALPGLALFVFFAICTFRLFVISVSKDYIVISGVCSKVNLTAIKKQTKSIILNAEGKSVKVIIKQRLKKIQPGAAIDVYVYKNAQAHQFNNEYVLPAHIAIDVK